jgi:hypothetical protein
MPSHLSIIIDDVEDDDQPDPRNSKHPIPSEMSYECTHLPDDGNDIIDDESSSFAADDDEDEDDEGSTQALSSTNVPPTKVVHAISFPSQSEAGDIVMSVDVNLFVSPFVPVAVVPSTS